MILHQLPVRDPNRLVYLGRASQNSDLRLTSLFSYPVFSRLRETLAPHMEMFSMSHQSLRQAMLPDAGGAEEKLLVQFVSGNAFNALGVTAAIGRVLEPSDDVTPGAHQVAVVSHAFWIRRLRADPRAVGSWIEVEQRPYQIVGVAQSAFTGAQPGILTDIWLPNMMFNADSLRAPNSNWLQLWGRLVLRNDTVGATHRRRRLRISTTRNRGISRTARSQSLEAHDASSGVTQVRQVLLPPITLAPSACAAHCVLNVATCSPRRGATRRWRFVRRSAG